MLTRSPRTGSISWAQGAVGDPDVVFLDTETTGLGAHAEIVDIAVIDRDGHVLMDTLVCPTRGIPREASNIHGILDHHVARAPAWNQVHIELMSILRGRRVIVFNAAYDQKMIRQCCSHFRLMPPSCAWECAMLAYAEYVGERSEWGRGYRWHRLEKAATAFGIVPGGHRARADAEACRQVVLRMAMG
ncbi:MAG TPA: 3'-5' exonuclease [Thermomicrobiales bacterium]|nr:3'-5' exonuclease [Thermomicrobiales bacterium]